MYTRPLARQFLPLALSAFWTFAALAQEPAPQPPNLAVNPSILYKVQGASERLEMTIHTSRILTMEKKIVQAQVNNPDVLELRVLSPHQIQVSAKASGVTAINLWGEDEKLSTIDVIVFNDVRELEMVLRSLFPTAALKVTPVSNSVAISGFVDQAEHVDRIIRVAEEYYPKVINNMTVGGCQQVLLHVKVMEVSRTKLRRLGFDFAKVNGGNLVASGVSGLLYTSGSTAGGLTSTAIPGGNTFAFGVVNNGSAFYGLLDALRHDNLLSILSDPTLVTVSGRAASFESGGEIPIPVPQSLGTISIEWKTYGTQIDFVPLVLGNGKIRLEVKPRISELDDTRSLTIQGTTVPGIKSREANTGVELMAGQTLAIAGLVQKYTEAENIGLPWISEVPYLGAAFRKVRQTTNEVELLMLVTPELVDPMDANEVPPCGPGTQTTDPSDWELFMKGHLEVPKCCPSDCGSGSAPPDGMIEQPGGKIPAPGPVDATTRANRASGPYNRHTSSKSNAAGPSGSTASRNGPPGLIGPVGYDVMK